MTGICAGEDSRSPLGLRRSSFAGLVGELLVSILAIHGWMEAE
jgi:hypothetical protein